MLCKSLFRAITVPMYKKKILGLVLGLLIAAPLKTLAATDFTPLESVAALDLKRYSGIWYEIASFPQRFQRGCTGTTAEYSLNQDSTVQVTNRCFKDFLDGPEKVAKGKAWIPNSEFPAQLKVQFFWPFSGDYWVIDIDPDYQWAVVGAPNRKYLWFLSRTPKITDELYTKLLESAETKEFDISKLKKTLQK
jgi:apolipoprotein D and lipocalin family protein